MLAIQCSHSNGIFTKCGLENSDTEIIIDLLIIDYIILLGLLLKRFIVNVKVGVIVATLL